MNILINRSSLADAMASIVSVVPPRSPKPVLSCVKLAASDVLTLTGTDLECSVTIHADAEVEEPGSVLVDAAKLYSIVREDNGDTIGLSVKGSELIVKGNGSTFKLFTSNVEDFPPTPETKGGETTLSIPASELSRLIDRTSYATAKEGTRYAFNGVMFEVAKDRLTLVATDGRRMALDFAKCEAEKLNHSPIVPDRSLSLLRKMNNAGSMTVTLADNSATFATEGMTFRTNLLEGIFPAYREVLPKDADKTFVCDASDLLSAVRRASILTTDDSKGIRCEFSKSGLTLLSRNPEAGEARIDFPGKYDGADLAIGFNPTFLAEALKHAEGEVTIRLTAANRPALIECGDAKAVIMPVNLQ